MLSWLEASRNGAHRSWQTRQFLYYGIGVAWAFLLVLVHVMLVLPPANQLASGASFQQLVIFKGFV